MIKTENLTRRYGDLVAVDSLSITVEPGQVLGFLGPNGAGKTTTMRMIAGFIAPSSGTVSVCGHSLTTDTVAAQACMGYLPEGAPGYDEMTVAGFLHFTADIRGLAGERRRCSGSWRDDTAELGGCERRSVPGVRVLVGDKAGGRLLDDPAADSTVRLHIDLCRTRRCDK